MPVGGSRIPWDGNEGALAFYARAGWEPCGLVRVAEVAGVRFEYERWRPR